MTDLSAANAGRATGSDHAPVPDQPAADDPTKGVDQPAGDDTTAVAEPPERKDESPLSEPAAVADPPASVVVGADAAVVDVTFAAPDLDPNGRKFLTFAITDEGRLTPEQINFINSIQQTETVLTLLFERPGRDGGIAVSRHNRAGAQLHWIASNFATVAERVAAGATALATFQQSIAFQEGAAVKNRYMAQLLGYAGLYVLTAVSVAWACGLLLQSPPAQISALCSLWCGTMAGSWASFAIRRVRIAFLDLIRPEDDLMAPPLRLLFIGVVSIALGLALDLHIIEMKVGTIETAKLLAPGTDLTVPLFVGFLFGLLELTMPRLLMRTAERQVAGADDKQEIKA